MNYKDLDVWKEARILVKATYECLADFPLEERFGLQSQIKRSVISIPSNIAEGCGRHHRKGSLQFFYIARGSAYELETQLYLSSDLGFLTEEHLIMLLNRLQAVKMLLNGLINRYRSLIDNN